MQSISELVLKYKGPHPYLKILRKKIEDGFELDEMQINMASKMLVSVAAIKKDKTLLPLEEIKDFNVDWGKYSKRPPYNHQKIATNWLLNKNKAILADDMGLGKRIANDVPVLTPDGWVLHGSLKVGDYVIGSDGKKTKVLATYPSNSDNYYTITFTDGTKIESCENHLWTVATPCIKNHNSEYINLTIKQMLDENLTLERKGCGHNENKIYKFKSFYKLKNKDCKWYIPIVKPVEFTPKPIDLDPYLLGVLLGDGCFRNPGVSVANADKELIENVKNRLPINSSLKQGNKVNYRFCLLNLKEKNYLKEYLINYNLLNTKSQTKFIPKEYKYNSIDVRLEMLQGLLDTDGYCSKKGTIQYYSVSKQLSDDVKELVQSLGGVARQTKKRGKYKLPDGTIRFCKICYILTINLPDYIIPFKLQRKVNNLVIEKKYFPSRGIKKIEFSRETKGQCIKVEAEDSLYVIDNYVVTHNTQSIVMSILEKNEKTIIICPKTLRLNWKIELSCFTDEKKISIIDNKWVDNKIVIINYDKIHKYVNEIVKAKFKLVVSDESHYVKNGTKSRRGKVFNKIANKSKVTWLITGTPMANKPMDFFNLLKICKHELGKNKGDFGRRYCDGKQTDFGWDYSGASNLKDLHYRTQDVMLRRLTNEVIELPDKQRIPYYLEFTSSQSKAYLKAVEDKFQDIYNNVSNPDSEHYQKNLFSGEGFIELSAKRMFCALEKLKDGSLIEILDNFISQGHKIVIFTNFTAVINFIKETYGKKCVILDGSVKEKQRQQNIEKFQTDSSIDICACNYIVGAEGTTLTSATIMIMNDLPFSPHLVLQAEKRIHRIGQKNKVQIYFPIYKNTKDEEIFEAIKQKMEYINTAIDNIDGVDFKSEGDLIKSLIKSKK